MTQEPKRTTEEIAELYKAGKCLYLAVDQLIADDVMAKIDAVVAVIDTKEKEIAELRKDYANEKFAREYQWKSWNEDRAKLENITALLKNAANRDHCGHKGNFDDCPMRVCVLHRAALTDETKEPGK